MIPQLFVEQWQKNAPWLTLGMIEQDLIISRALVEIYNQNLVKQNLLFRGGTALNKLYISPSSRYSEDIDLVQLEAQPIGDTVDEIRSALDPWLGKPKRKASERSFKLFYRYASVDNVLSRLKIEINTMEHLNVEPVCKVAHEVNSNWFDGNALITTYVADELIATKLRALYQRRKGRDLFDLWYVLKNNLVKSGKVVEIFHKYCAYNNEKITKKQFLESMELKKESNDFKSDIIPLLNQGIEWDFDEAMLYVTDELINIL